jgi:hypothetical protein
MLLIENIQLSKANFVEISAPQKSKPFVIVIMPFLWQLKAGENNHVATISNQ